VKGAAKKGGKKGAKETKQKQHSGVPPIHSIPIYPPMICRKGVPDNSPGITYLLTLNTRGKDHEITLKQRRPGGQDEDLLVFREKDVATMSFCPADPIGGKPYFEFSIKKKEKEWSELLSTCEATDGPSSFLSLSSRHEQD
jgi:hypothetical protein